MNYLTKENVQEVLGLTLLQEHAVAQPEQYLQWRLLLEGEIDPERLQQAWDDVIDANDGLRLIFRQAKSRMVQVVLKQRPVTMEVHDLRGQPEAVQESAMRALAEAQAAPFALTEGPLFRLALLWRGESSANLLWSCHPTLLDSTSRELILSDLQAAYGARMRGEPLRLPRRGSSREYLSWFAGQDWTPIQAFWEGQLRGVSGPTTLPADHAAPEELTLERAAREVTLPVELSRRLRALLGEQGVSPATVASAAWAILLSVFSNESEVLYGWESSIRPQSLAGAAELIGPFQNRLPVRMAIDGDEPLPDLLRRLERLGRQLAEHGHTSLEALSRHAGLPERSDLFESVVAVSSEPAHMGERPLFAVRQEATTGSEVQPLVLRIQTGEVWQVTCDYASALFDSASVDRLLSCYQTLLSSMAWRPEARVCELELLSDEERQRITVEFNRTEPPGPLDLLAHQVIEARAAQQPEAVAAICGTEQITYGELNARANQMASWLRAQGLGRDDLAGLFADRSIAMLVAILAVAKAGGAYLPLDPEHPDGRLEGILDQSRVKVLLTEDRYLQRSLRLAHASSQPATVFCLDQAISAPGVPDSTLLVSLPAQNPPFINEPGDLANVFFTSGSTGVPKGAMIEQVGMLNHLWAKIRLLGMDEQSAVVQNASHCFDISVWQFLAPLMTGGRVLIYPNETALDPQALLAAVRRDGATILEVVPTMLEMLIQVAAALPPEERKLPHLRHLFSTGEALPVALCRRWLQLYPQVPVVNGYGATECSDDTTHEVIAEEPPAGQTYMSVGRPIPGFNIYILDRWRRPVPVGCNGEIYFTGIGVGRGYLGDPAQTEQSFLPNPFQDDRGSRIYRTGDLGRYLPDGRILFVGRVDHQVKVRGYRIELGEIEAAMLRHPAVAQSVAAVRTDASSTPCLVGYAVPGGPLIPAELQEFLASQLPDYMIPEHLVLLRSFPVTSNGKVDRSRLPDPDWSEADGQRYVAPRNRTEMAMVSLWEQVLGVRPVGVHDDFFALGGHSLKAVALVGAVQNHFGVRLPLVELFRAPTVAKICERLQEEERSSGGCLVPLRQGEGSPLFLLHPGGGSVMSYSALVSLLDAGGPVYGIQPVGFDSDEEPLTSIEAMADHYAGLVRAACPAGPYRLAGWSFGGMLAVEVARRLEESGHPVQFLGILDTSPYGSDAEPVQPAEESRAFIIRHFNWELGLHLSVFEGLSDQQVIELLVRTGQKAGLWPEQATVASGARLIRLSDTCRLAAHRYRYSGPIRSDICLFRTTTPSPRGEDVVEPERWRDWTTGAIQVFDLPGDHHTMVNPPHVHRLAEAMQMAIEAAGRRVLIG